MPATHYRILDEILAQPLGDTLVLFHPETERLLSLNASATRIWALLAEEASLERIVDRLVDEFDCPMALIQKQASEFLSQLEREQIIRRAA